MAWPVIDGDDVAWIGAAGMREVDRVMIDELGVSLLQMMENAGRWLAEVVRLDRGPGARVVVLAGGGGNGGGGLVSARHLHNAGFDVRVELVVDRQRLTPATAHQLAILDRMHVPVHGPTGEASVGGADVVVDAMVGYSLAGSLRGRAHEAARAVGASGAEVVSLDLPSGTLADGDGDEPSSIAADLTVTLCVPKVGLRANPRVGRLLLADISVPASVVTSVTSGPAPPFGMGPVLEIRTVVPAATQT